MVNVAVPHGTILPDAPYWLDQSGDVWMGLPNGEFSMITYHSGQVRWVGDQTATLASLKSARISLVRSMTYPEAMVMILLRVINRFEGAMRSANLI